MKKTILFVLLAALLFAGVSCKKNTPSVLGAVRSFSVEGGVSAVENQPAKVVLLYGQSNATGVAANQYLQQKSPADYAEAAAGYERILINFITENGANSSGGYFVPATLGQGASKDHFGPEVGIASDLSARFPNETIFIIKYSWGGSILDDQWLDGNGKRGELYTAALNFTKTSLDFLKGQGYRPQIAAVCWMQGESDAVYLEKANDYYDNTKRFVSYLRKDLASYAEPPFLFLDAGIAEIDIWLNPGIVNEAKARFAETDDNNIYFSTTALGMATNLEPEGTPDLAHYDAQSAFALGKEFAKYIR